MTLNEFIEKAKQIDPEGNSKLRVRAFGGMRHGINLTNVSVGFDWDNGHLVLEPEIPLQIYDKNLKSRK